MLSPYSGEKASQPISVRFAGRLMLDKKPHAVFKSTPPISGRFAGKLMLVKPLQPEKAFQYIVVTVLGMFTEVKPPAAKIRVVPSLLYSMCAFSLYLVLAESIVKTY